MELKKVVIVPDSFKGTLTSKQVADIISIEVNAAFPACVTVKIPVADGGEGSVDTIISALGGEKYETQANSPDDRQISAVFGIAGNGSAILEMAQSSGITKQNGLHPMTSNTYGFGQLILAALEHGARDFIVCIGGSATTDGGCGMAAALGVRFLDRRGESFMPCGGTLQNIERIDTSSLDERIAESRFTVMCDVDNPLYGENGAAYIYSPQKGAKPEQIPLLDKGLQKLGKLFFEMTGEEIADYPGAGAAGGLGAGCIAFLNAKLKSGIETILEICRFKEQITDADIIITGEGKLDAQSFSGKVLSGVLREAGDVPVWSVCGICECDESLVRRHDLTVFQTSEGLTAKESMENPAKYLSIAVRKAMRYASNLP